MCTGIPVSAFGCRQDGSEAHCDHTISGGKKKKKKQRYWNEAEKGFGGAGRGIIEVKVGSVN